MAQVPEKSRYKVGEVCRIADTQPYVLRFWENEFPQLKPARGRGGSAVYTRDDLATVLRIKRLLHQEAVTIADARDRLDSELDGEESLDDLLAATATSAAGEATAPPVDEPPESADRAEARGSDGGSSAARAVAKRAASPPRRSKKVSDAPEEPATSIASPDAPGNASLPLEGGETGLREKFDALRSRYETACREIKRLRSELDAANAFRDERNEAAEDAERLREELANLRAASAFAQERRLRVATALERVADGLADLVESTDTASQSADAVS